MSSIKHKGPNGRRLGDFEALNSRKPTSEKVGQTYGERRGRETQQPSKSTGWLQSIKDRFTGAKCPKDIRQFSSTGDRFIGTNDYSAQNVIQRNRMIESGMKSIVHPEGDQYIQWLNAAISYLGKGPKDPKKS